MCLVKLLGTLLKVPQVVVPSGGSQDVTAALKEGFPSRVILRCRIGRKRTPACGSEESLTKQERTLLSDSEELRLDARGDVNEWKFDLRKRFNKSSSSPATPPLVSILDPHLDDDSLGKALELQHKTASRRPQTRATPGSSPIIKDVGTHARK